MKQLQLRQQRDVGALFRDAFAVFGRHALLFILLSAAVVVPAELIVEGIGLEMLTSSYDSSPSVAEAASRRSSSSWSSRRSSPRSASTPCTDRRRQRPSAGRVFVAGFEAFTPFCSRPSRSPPRA